MVDANDSQTLNVEEQINRLLGIKTPPKKTEGLGEGVDVFTAPSPYVGPPNPKEARIEPRIEPKAEARAEVRPRAEARPAFVEPDEDYSGSSRREAL